MIVFLVQFHINDDDGLTTYKNGSFSSLFFKNKYISQPLRKPLLLSWRCSYKLAQMILSFPSSYHSTSLLVL